MGDAAHGLGDGVTAASMWPPNVLHHNSSRTELASMCTTAKSTLRPGGRSSRCSNGDMRYDP